MLIGLVWRMDEKKAYTYMIVWSKTHKKAYSIKRGAGKPNLFIVLWL